MDESDRQMDGDQDKCSNNDNFSSHRDGCERRIIKKNKLKGKGREGKGKGKRTNTEEGLQQRYSLRSSSLRQVPE